MNAQPLDANVDFADLTSEATRAAIANAVPVGGWPDPAPLRDELPSVPPFDLALLPSELRPWVADISERMNCPVDFVAIPAMVAAGSLIGRRIGIRPQRFTLWQETGNLWGCIVGPPGAMKSPAVAEALKPLLRLEAQAHEEMAAKRREYDTAMALHKLKADEAHAGAKKALKDKKGPDPEADARATLAALIEPVRPPERRYLVNDATMERLGEICADNPEGVLVARDELLTLFAELDREERAAARGFYLAGWSGQDGYTFDRIMRGRTHCPAVNLSLFGTTQPGRLASYMRQSLTGLNDGLVQRIQMLAWPDHGGEFRNVDRYANVDARNDAFACYDRLAKLDATAAGGMLDDFADPNDVPFLRLGDDAQEGFDDWRIELEAKVRDPDLPPAFAAHLSKYRGLIPRLALICHLASGGTGPVSLEAAAMAWRWGAYLEAHAWRAYASTGTAAAEAARAVWRRIKRHELPNPFTAREVQRKGWTGLKDKDVIALALEALVDADWLDAHKPETGGRPSTLYVPNPKALVR